MQFKKISLNQAAVNAIQQSTNWCSVCASGAHDKKSWEANPNSLNNVGNVQRGGGLQNFWK